MKTEKIFGTFLDDLKEINNLNINEFSLEDYDEFMEKMNEEISKIKKVEEKLKKININEFNVMVYGKYNYGKSQLLNALLNKKEFKVNDIRETTEIKKVKSNNIVFIDTPGLDADIQKNDDKLAKNAIDETDLILFVHRADVGELDSKEVEELKKLKEKNKSVLLILNAIDQIEDLTSLINKIRTQINFEIDIVPVSAKNSMHSNKKIKDSSNIALLKEKIDNLKDDILKDKERNLLKINEKLETQKNKSNLDNILSSLNDKINRETNELKSDISDIDNKYEWANNYQERSDRFYDKFLYYRDKVLERSLIEDIFSIFGSSDEEKRDMYYDKYDKYEEKAYEEQRKAEELEKNFKLKWQISYNKAKKDIENVPKIKKLIEKREKIEDLINKLSL